MIWNIEQMGKERSDFVYVKGREAWESDKLYGLIRELCPGVILTDRLDLDLPLSGGDIKTPEQAQPRNWVKIEVEGKKVPVTWEACQTMGGTWGYCRDERSWRSSKQLITTLVDSVSKGGNFLLNVGPNARGEFDGRVLERLEQIGDWMRRHGRAIYGCTQAPERFACPADCRLTYNPEKKRLYIHLFNWPYGMLHLDGKAYVEEVEYIQFLHDGSEVLGPDMWQKGALEKMEDKPDRSLGLPNMEPEGIPVPVLELFLK